MKDWNDSAKFKSLLNSQSSSSILSFGHLSFILQNTSLLNTIGTHCKAQPARQLGVAGFFFCLVGFVLNTNGS